MSAYAHVLLAADFSDESATVARKAAEIARAGPARLSLVHVVEVSPLEYGGEQVLPVEFDIERELLERARTALRALGLELGVAEDDQYVEVGSTKSEIIRLARERRVDLIVLGSHGRRGLALLLGSTASGVLNSAPCDVLAVRIGGKTTGS